MNVLVMSSYALVGRSIAYMLQSLLADDVGIVMHCTPEEVADCVRAIQPDIIVIEAVTNVGMAIAATRSSAQMEMNIPILMLGADDDEVKIHWAILAGADGYLGEDASPATLIATMQGMARNELGLSRTTSLAVVRRLRQAFVTQSKPVMCGEFESQLTKRERQVFALVRRGRLSREIAEELGIAEATVYKHIQNVLSKLHVHNRMQVFFMEEPDARNDPLPTRALTTLVEEPGFAMQELDY